MSGPPFHVGTPRNIVAGGHWTVQQGHVESSIMIDIERGRAKNYGTFIASFSRDARKLKLDMQHMFE
eukprot:7804965-Pyramimonas_sp.AAC.1